MLTCGRSVTSIWFSGELSCERLGGGGFGSFSSDGGRQSGHSGRSTSGDIGRQSCGYICGIQSIHSQKLSYILAVWWVENSIVILLYSLTILGTDIPKDH